ncbi:pseudouridine synthase [Saccharibacillus alkalitolerans]|uniref:Pseudouridine synthase n=1 Tax=Saccharibacillus alkalitolerans TaxID=2705290 RepID=A0ABX0F2Q6_9BACL|nr:pseudouridine synthase [Saccharibacillus alkalitolerans]NGZ75196.1 pseudouridine synthase [Saccharibacillus alkalitolerans]
MRINKYISETGYCSRRETDRLIAAGRITIDGEVCAAGAEVSPGSLVKIDGEDIPPRENPVYLALHKPRGIVCTHDRGVSGNIADYMNYPVRIFPVGRLDKDSEGLILLTNDGGIVNRMMRAEYGHEKEYAVTVDKPVTEEFLGRMAAGVAILGTVTLPCRTYRIGERAFGIVLTQGLNRQIRRMCKELGYRVTELRRERIVNLHLGGLDAGRWRELEAEELEGLRAALGEANDSVRQAGNPGLLPE